MGNPGSSYPLRSIHVGVGGRGRAHVRTAVESDFWRPVGLVDIVPDALASARAITGLPESACFTRLDDALSSIDADAVIVSTPVEFHTENILAALRANRHVLTEKCFTVGIADAETCVAEAAARNLKLMVVQNARLSAPARTLRRIVAEEIYGPLGLFLMSYFKDRGAPYPPSPHMHLWQQGVHELDTVLSIVQRPLRRVWGLSNNPPWCDWPSASTVQVIAEFDGGISGTYVSTSNARAGGYEFRLECADAAVISTSRGTGKLRVLWGPHDQREELIPLDPLDLHGISDHPSAQAYLRDGPGARPAQPAANLSDLQIYRDFAEYLIDDREPESSGRRNLDTLRFLDAVQRSTEHHRPIEIG